MTPEERELLHRAVALGEANNEILRGLQRNQRLSRFLSVLYWLIIIGTAVGAFYFAKPYIQQVEGLYGGAQNVLDQFNQTGKGN